MKKNNILFLTHILDSIDAIGEFMQDISTKDDFIASRKTRDAVLRNFQIIGEAVRNLEEGYINDHKEVEWEKIIAMRNIIIHEYFGVDMNLVWDTIKDDLPELKKHIQMLLETTS